ncbi:MAG: indole-3-glycerol-phosphate synthase [Desulfovibrio sp.]|nr:indole-3-glycerol-phosphate synthase [Desulfovibrio sp.]
MQLERFRKAKEGEIAALRARSGKDFSPFRGDRLSFTDALRDSLFPPLPVIAEYKRASPSAGDICGSLSVAEVARAYVRAHATCLSILTEENFFKGHLSFLHEARQALSESPLPLLRKDFIFDPLQIEATAETEASALLLIVRLTPSVSELRSLREQALRYGIEAVVEVFDASDLALARESGATLIQVNARDLEHFTVDTMATLELAHAHHPEKGETWIAASGIRETADLIRARDAGFSAVLCGTQLMQGGEPEKSLRLLRGEG